MSKTTYKVFDKFLVRTPAKSLNDLAYILLNNSNVELSVGQILKDVFFVEAIYIASPVLHEEIKKIINGTLPNKDNKRFNNSIVRYYTRMCTRCTPFGLFAGLALGNFSNTTKITAQNPIFTLRNTRLDMSYTCEIFQSLMNISEIKNKLTFYPNNSIYTLGDKIRYVKYSPLIGQVLAISK